LLHEKTVGQTGLMEGATLNSLIRPLKGHRWMNQGWKQLLPMQRQSNSPWSNEKSEAEKKKHECQKAVVFLQ
jgi:hypothetical protein